jgi:CopZ-like zinc binding protein/2Fe-2S iron-sulfur cluster protein
MKQSSHPCPSCGKRGKKVKMITVRSLANAPENLPTEPDPDYQFCSTHGCTVVYFSALESCPELHLNDVNVRVGQKKPGAPTPVCYCFHHTEEEIAAEIESTGATTRTDGIRAEMKAGNCFCETSNPQGSCCWANVQAVLNRFEEKLS